MFARYKDVISGSFLLVFSVVFYIGSFYIENLTGAKLGPSFVPQLVSIIMAILSVIILIDGIKKSKSNEALTGEHKKSEKTDAAKKNLLINPVNLSILAMLVYVALMDSIGFIIMTTIYLTVQIYLLSGQRKNKIPIFFLTSAIASVSVYYIFVKVFVLLLPAGILG